MDKITLPPGTKIPNHVVIMPDGDRRWARLHGISSSDGQHKAGIANLANLARSAREWGIHTVSAWGLSTENWLERPKDEIDILMRGICDAMDYYFKEMMDSGVRIVHLGRKDRLPKFLLDKIAEVEKKTFKNTKHVFNIGLDYNGWDEIVRMTQKIVESGVSPKKIDRKMIDQNMDTSDQPYPYVDLYIRTSGEQRTSGFMMWQADYAEFYWEQDYFPDFTPEKLREAVLDYSRRRRRFGGNDAEEHFKFDPKIVANLELQWRHALSLRQDEKFRDLVIRYVREHYGLSKELAKTAGIELAKALVYGRHENWDKARQSLEGLYEIVRKTLGLALEPKIVANIEIDLWKNGVTEEKLKNLLAEKFRVSSFQAAKSAHLGWLASTSTNGDKKSLLEKFYQAIKERVA
jgi:undecaprenyl diphosphate synthase